MKKIYIIALATAMLAACSEDVLEERVSEKNEAAAKSLLQVRTRTSDEAAIAYPVQVYVFQGDVVAHEHSRDEVVRVLVEDADGLL